MDTAMPKRVRAIKLEMPLRLVGPKHGRKNWLITIITASRRRERGPTSTNKTKSPALITNQGRLIVGGRKLTRKELSNSKQPLPRRMP